MKRFSFRRPLIALALIAAFFGQVTWALAGTTGGLSGQVTDETGAPVAGAAVKAISASQSATATTDNSGHFNFLALAPDTYTVSVQKDGYAPVSEPGLTVFADNNITVAVKMAKALKTIAKVAATSAGSLVKGGVGQDVYNVTSSTMTATTALGGGGNLNSAYSAISSVPGVQVPSGGAGWSQNVYIRGSQAFFSGFEYDGIPVNRAFDNYNASTESNLGLQELQVYTGGGPASNSSSGTAGFVNQVFKTGTYPGYMSLSGGIGSPAFYHQLKVEAGGATPDRRFSYYVGLSGYDQDFRMINSQNGANLMQPGGIYAQYSPIFDYGSSVVPTSDLGLAPQVDCQTDSYGVPLLNANGSFMPVNPNNSSLAPDACLVQHFGLVGQYSSISDRESVANFHFAIPLKNGLRDDLQLLTSASSLKSYTYGSANDLGTQYDPNVGMTVGAALLGDLTNNPGGAGASYVDANVYNAPFGTSVAGLTAQPYYQPSSPTSRAEYSQIPLNQEDNYWNDTGIVKLQYTHQFSSNAYARVMGYTFFSDWTQAGAVDAAGYGSGYTTGPSPNYDLITHTAGGELQLVDQVNAQHLLELTGNYATATVARFNNTGFIGGSSPVGDISQGSNGAYTCYSPGGMSYDQQTGAYDTANPVAGSQIPCYEASSFNTSSSHPYGCAGGASCNPYTTPQSANGTYATLWNGDASGTFNTVGPKFSFVSLTDQWRPNDKWLLNLGLRYENYTYDLANSNTPANNFYAQIVANYSCWAPGVGVATKVLPPGVPPPAPVQYVNGDCNAGLAADGVQVPNGITYVHPNGTTQDGVAAPNFTAISPNSVSQNFWSPRFSATYTESPDTVWRVSAGRYTEPPITASLQYLYASGAASTTWANFENLGFFSPYHDIPSQSSAQGDISLERHIRGTDMSFKITPFYNRTNGFQGDAFIGQGFVTQVPLGNFRSYGVEFGMTKGDFNRNGLSGSLSLTYTKSQVQYQSEFGGALPNQIDTINNYIKQYNDLANGSPCYTPATIVGGKLVAGTGETATQCATDSTAILNPYYGKPSMQGGLDPNGWYTPPTYAFQPGVYTQPGYFDSPFVGSLILNYRHNKLAVTPSIQYTMGTSYGTPFDVQGLDPRVCMGNAASNPGLNGMAGVNQQSCDYTQLANLSATSLGYMYIPNPQTGSFASLGQYREPGLLTGNLQISYDVSPRVNATLTLANVFHTCFGGTKAPWATAYPAGSAICGYNVNPYYFSNFQNGAGQANPGNIGAYSAAANGGVTPYPWEFQSYSPSTGSPAANGSAGAQLPQPFNVFLNLSVKV